eukprot:scaffold620113_cov27-Prasinocladus_malaysianus.AAC.1
MTGNGDRGCPCTDNRKASADQSTTYLNDVIELCQHTTISTSLNIWLSIPYPAVVYGATNYSLSLTSVAFPAFLCIHALAFLYLTLFLSWSLLIIVLLPL